MKRRTSWYCSTKDWRDVASTLSELGLQPGLAGPDHWSPQNEWQRHHDPLEFADQRLVSQRAHRLHRHRDRLLAQLAAHALRARELKQERASRFRVSQLERVAGQDAPGGAAQVDIRDVPTLGSQLQAPLGRAVVTPGQRDRYQANRGGQRVQVRIARDQRSADSNRLIPASQRIEHGR